MIHQLRAEGLAIVYISHRMNEVYDLADRVSILRDGTYAGTLDRAEASPDTIVKRMVGRELSSLYTNTGGGATKSAETVLKVRDLSDGRRVHGCSFDLRAGELVGLAGLVGSGHSELAQAIFGARARKTGEMWLDGKPFAPQTPQDAIAARVAYLTEDRRGGGLFLDMSCEENINTGVLRDDARWGMVLNRSRARERANESIRNLSVRVPNASFPVGGLSGGNQQKVLLSRWLQIRPRVLILDEPTRGVDIGAKSEIYRIIDALVREGMAILVISSELPEVIGVSDRILVMHEGRISGEVGGETGIASTQENIMAFASGLGLSSAA